MLRKLRPGEAPTGTAWKETADYTNDIGEAFTLNEYFAARPEMMLGQMRLGGGMYRRQRTDAGTGRTQLGRGAGAGRRAAAAEHLRGPLSPSRRADPRPDHSRAGLRQTQCLLSSRRHGLHPGGGCSSSAHRYAQRDAFANPPFDSGAGCGAACLRSQMDGSDEEQVVEARRQLNLAYDRFVVASARSISMPISARSMAIPTCRCCSRWRITTRKRSGRPKPRFSMSGRFIIASPSNPSANRRRLCLVSLNEQGRVDLDHMAGLLNKPAGNSCPI